MHSWPRQLGRFQKTRISRGKERSLSPYGIGNPEDIIGMGRQQGLGGGEAVGLGGGEAAGVGR